MSLVASPQLPVELLTRIIHETWTSSLTRDERIIFMTTSLLVNKTWMTEFVRIASADVHIPSQAFVDQYSRFYYQRSPIFNFNKSVKRWWITRASSITFEVEHPDALPMAWRKESRSGATVSTFLRDMRCADGQLHKPIYPNINQLNIVYHDSLMDESMDQWRWSYLPRQITDLNISFVYSDAVPPFLVDALRSTTREIQHIPNRMWYVKCLGIHGASKAFVQEMLRACPKVVELQTDVAMRRDELPAQFTLTQGTTYIVPDVRETPRMTDRKHFLPLDLLRQIEEEEEGEELLRQKLMNIEALKESNYAKQRCRFTRLMDRFRDLSTCLIPNHAC